MAVPTPGSDTKTASVLDDLDFLPNDCRTKKTYCECGCPPSADADLIEPDTSDQDIQDHIENIMKFKFLTRAFSQYCENDKIQIRNKVVELITPKGWRKRTINNGCLDKRFSRYDIESVFEFVMMHPQLISVGDFLRLMGWDPIRTPFEFSVCYEEALTNGHYRNGKNHRDQTMLLAPIRILIEEFQADVNYTFVHRHDPDEEYPEGKIFSSRYPLHLAIMRQMPKYVIEYLLANGANPFLENKFCFNAFYCCLYSWHPDLLDLFTARLKEYVSAPPFSYACDSCTPSQIGILDKLKSMGFDMNACYKGIPAIINLFRCTAGRNEQDYYKFLILKWFTENGANVNITDQQGRSLLHYVCRSPWENYICPAGLHYLIECSKFKWLLRDSKGMLPLEYTLDYHLEFYDPDISGWGQGSRRPNYLCLIILKTGFENITDTAIPKGMKPGDRLKLAKAILVLKYNSLAKKNLGLMTTGQQLSADEARLMQLIRDEWGKYYGWDRIKTILGYMPEKFTLKTHMLAATTEVERNLVDHTTPYYLIRKIICTDIIRQGNDEVPQVSDDSYDSDQEEYFDPLIKLVDDTNINELD